MRKYWFLAVIIVIVMAVLVWNGRRVDKPLNGISTGYRIEKFVSGLEVPWSMVSTSGERMLVSERKGWIRIIQNTKLADKPLIKLSGVYAVEEAGLMGITIDPNYDQNKYIYACYAFNVTGKPQVKVVRLVDQGDTAREDKTIIGGWLASADHDGCRIKFGPDKKLYVTTGEATQKELAQDLTSLNGKILRVNNDGSIPNDNPFKNSAIWSYGHRNPQGITWDPRNGNIWESEHGPSGFDGPGGGDEINLIKKGLNYGWPLAHHEIRVAGTEFPKLLFTPAIAPSGAMFYDGKLWPQFANNLFFTALRGTGLYRAVITEADPEKIASFEKLPEISVGRIRDVIEGPDGMIYFATSNRDGRGIPQPGDDQIYRITK